MRHTVNTSTTNVRGDSAPVCEDTRRRVREGRGREVDVRLRPCVASLAGAPLPPDPARHTSTYLGEPRSPWSVAGRSAGTLASRLRYGVVGRLRRLAFLLAGYRSSPSRCPLRLRLTPSGELAHFRTGLLSPYSLLVDDVVGRAIRLFRRPLPLKGTRTTFLFPVGFWCKERIHVFLLGMGLLGLVPGVFQGAVVSLGGTEVLTWCL